MKKSLFLLSLITITHINPLHGMLASPIKKFNQMRRHISYEPETLGKAPCNVEHFLKQMPKKLNFTDTKCTVHEINTLNPENKNLMLAHVLHFISPECDIYGEEKPKIKPEMVMAIVHLIRSGADANTLMTYWMSMECCHNNLYPLRVALELENIKFIKFLLNHSANVHGPEEICDSLQDSIFYAKKIKIAKILFEHGLRLDLEGRKRHYMHLIGFGTNIEFIKLYLKYGAPIDPTILHFQDFEDNDPELIQKTKMLLTIAPHIINAKNGGRTPLNSAQQGLINLYQDENMEEIQRMREYITLLKKYGAKTAAELRNLE